jgi:Tfp pilus assembly PilM family ATPase
VLAVDWGYSNTTLCIVGDGRPLYSRRIHDCAFGLVLEAIMRLFDVTLDDAQHLAETQGLSAEGPQHEADVQVQAAISDAARAALDGLTRQIARTREFTESQRRQLQPAAVWLLGGGATLRNVAPNLERALGLPVHVWTLAAETEPIPCAAAARSAVFGGAAALSASAWRTT